MALSRYFLLGTLPASLVVMMGCQGISQDPGSNSATDSTLTVSSSSLNYRAEWKHSRARHSRGVQPLRPPSSEHTREP